ncbi:ABC transporter substrate-binding protein [Roseimaritima ulvae]|uniref:Nickel-binding periplasmic protein n=1 Tax=Roseimaritima ulvae TaxID=980254 RepID=A0A5B9QJV5_9BACT|nr:ABC transporter substrate-binding protein [Roseimaritima ulvae]QEG39214.1 Nickel-binding periplasmic protein precursor [Roseimaritima ulvae]
MSIKRVSLFPLPGIAVLSWLACISLVVVAASRPARAQVEPLRLRDDDASRRALPQRVPGSHVKVYLPSLPYLYTSHAINGALIKPSNNPRGWDYEMATAHRKIDSTTYEFDLRSGVRFQDGSPFDADAVIRNMEAFKQQPTRYSKIDQVFDRAEKVDDDTVRFHLTEEYGCFMNDLIWMQFYTDEYLRLNGGWNGKKTCPNLSRPGPYGLGPYILKQGYIEGDRATATAVLEANPYYWNPEYPKVETITIYTRLDSDQAKDSVLYQEGEVDIAMISPEYKVETILSPFAKVITAPSNDSLAIHMNLINGNPRLRDQSVRRALNEALHQRNLLHFVFDNEGVLSPTLASPLFPGVDQAIRSMRPFSEIQDPYQPAKQAALRSTLQGLRLKVLTQDRFLALWRGIESQLGKVGVTLDIVVVDSEKEIFEPLLQTNADANEVSWDLLVWGNDDWFFNHPFTAFLVYRTSNAWSTVYPDAVMDGYIDEMFRASVDTPEFAQVCGKIMQRAFDEAYMLFVPTPNKVIAMNKEVVYEPYRMACAPLWSIQITNQHWSIRKGPYANVSRGPVRMTRFPRSLEPN